MERERERERDEVPAGSPGRLRTEAGRCVVRNLMDTLYWARIRTHRALTDTRTPLSLSLSLLSCIHTQTERGGKITWCMLIGAVMRPSPYRVVIVSHPCLPPPTAHPLPLPPQPSSLLLISLPVPLLRSAICTVLKECNYFAIVFFKARTERVVSLV